MRRICLVFLLLFSGFSAFPQLNTDHYFYIARSRIYFGNYVSAIENFNIVIKLKPYLPEPYFYRGMAKLYIDDFRGAKADFDKAIEIREWPIDDPDTFALLKLGFGLRNRTFLKLLHNDFDLFFRD